MNRADELAGLGPGRIAVLPAALADQIAAGEVVERPGSIVKELVENAIDAGATRIEVELDGGGRDRIRVIDDGRGIHRDDLILAVTRHATSKLHAPEQLVEIHTLGFRGEALASIAAVARVELRSRRSSETLGHRLATRPGEAPTLEPIGMPSGTQIEVGQLFANVPARRKFLRAEATEVGHCVDAVIRAGLVHPNVGFRVRHDGRELLELRPESQTSRVIAVLERRGGVGPFHHFTGERDGIAVAGWFASPGAATRQASFVVVRRRVVRERTLAAMLSAGQSVACLFVDPPHGTVDVNVHPQKSEVRFALAQRVYAVTRELIDEGLATAVWRATSEPEADEPHADVNAALAGWSRREGLGLVARDLPGSTRVAGGYRLGTRASEPDTHEEREQFRGEVDRLRSSLSSGARWAPDTSAPILPHTEAAFEERASYPTDPGPDALPEPSTDPGPDDLPEPSTEPGPRLLTVLPGPVAVFEFDDELLVADLRRVRAHLVRRRLVRELAATGPDGQAPAQILLQPIVVPRSREDRQRLLEAVDGLRRLGLELEGFGAAAVLVRAVPAALPKLLDARGIGALLDRLIPWLGIRDQRVDPTGFVDVVAQISASATVDISPRLARRWIAELLHDQGGRFEPDAGVRRWSAAALVEDER